MARRKQPIPLAENLGKDANLVIGVGGTQKKDALTARKAGGLTDMMLPVSPRDVPLKKALENLAKGINLALQTDFLETELDGIYKAARVRKGSVEVVHADYIGLGDGLFASLGKAAKSIQLTFRGPDPASPEGRGRFEQFGSSPLSGFFHLVGRKLDLLQEFEDKVPMYLEQLLDRLEATGMIRGWNRAEWRIETAVVGLDITLRPAELSGAGVVKE